MSKWTSEAGPIQTKRVSAAIQALSWRGKATVTLTGTVGGECHRQESYCPMSPPSDECQAVLSAIGDKFGWKITRENFAVIASELEAATKALVVPVIDERQTPEELAQVARERAEQRAQDEEKSRQHAADYSRILAELKAEYPWAKPADGKTSEYARAAANLRKELALTFPGVKFSVRSESYSMGNSIDYRWEMGPTTDEVRKIADKYQGGTFDGMEDIYRDDNSAASHAVETVLGQAKYCHGQRDIPDEVWQTVGRALCEAQHVEYSGNNTRHVFGENDDRDLLAHLSPMFSETSFPVGAVVTGVKDNDDCENFRECYRIVFDSPAVATAPATTGAPIGGQFHIEKHHHTKRDFDMWIVILANRVERDEFERLRESCESAAGWYSRQWGRVPGGFAFKSEENAQAWAQVAIAATAASPPQSASVPASNGAPVRPAANVELAQRFRTMADGMEETIDAKTAPLSQNWTPKRGRQHASRCHDGENLRRAQRALRALADAHESGAVPPILAGIRTKREVCDMTATRSDNSGGYYEHIDTGEPRDISEQAKALRALVESGKSDGDREAELKAKREADISRQVDELRRSDIPGFFPTPPDIARQVIEVADICHAHRVLEPSAGIGSLAEACPNIGNVDCIERQYTLADICSCKGFAVAREDFLTVELDTWPTRYDRIIMNPPFENSQDAEHIRHAFQFLKAGGRLVAICSAGVFFRDDRKCREFREWIDEIGAVVESLPDGAFDSKDAFRRTGTACKLVTIDKPAERRGEPKSIESEPIRVDDLAEMDWIP